MIIDMHVHTNKYSKCSLLDPDEAVKRAKAHGLDGICLVEHNAIWDKEEIKYLCERHKYLVLRGMEVDTGYGHILVFGLDSYSKEMEDIERLREITKQRGSLMIAAHPFRTPVYPQNGYGDWQLNLPFEQGVRRKLFSLVNGIEVFNSRSKPDESLLSLKIAQFLRIKTFAGSDAHKLSELGASATVFNDTIKDEESFLRVLKDDTYYGVNIGEKQ